VWSSTDGFASPLVARDYRRTHKLTSPAWIIRVNCPPEVAFLVRGWLKPPAAPMRGDNISGVDIA
jgi:hypothetical protein